MENSDQKEGVSFIPISFNELQERVKEYKALGLNPLALATGCAVKVDLARVVYPALKDLRRTLESEGLEIAPREDAEVVRGSGIEIMRKYYPLGDEAEENVYKDSEEIVSKSPTSMITVIQVYQRYADSPEAFAKLVKPLYLSIAKLSKYIRRKLRIGKGHSIITPFMEDQFASIDFIAVRESRDDVFSALNNDTIHIIDPSEPPGERRQVFGAISNALNDVFVLGFHKNISIAPLINSPNDELTKVLLNNMKLYASEYGFKVIDVPRAPRGRLLLGATVFGESDRKPPMFEELAQEGMKIIVTRPFGELAPLNVYIASIVDESILSDLKRAGISIEELIEAKERAFNTIARPNIEAAKTIYEYLPEYDEKPDPEKHIISTTDITGPGIFVFHELAEKLNAYIHLDEIPLLFPEFSRFATKYFIIPNATSGTNGAFVIVAHKNIADSIVDNLEKNGLEPHIVGEIVEVRKRVGVKVPKILSSYVADKKLLSYFELG